MDALVIVAIVIGLFVVFFIAFSVFILARRVNKNNIISNNIVNHQVPGNASPTLTEMIDYHKQNEDKKVDYEI